MQLSEIAGLLGDSRIFPGIIASLVGAAFYLMVRAEWPSLRPSEPSSQVITPLRLSALVLLAALIGIIGTGVLTGRFSVLGTSALSPPTRNADMINLPQLARNIRELFSAPVLAVSDPDLSPRDLLIIAAFGYVGLDLPAIIQKLILLPAAIVKGLTDLAKKLGGAK